MTARRRRRTKKKKMETKTGWIYTCMSDGCEGEERTRVVSAFPRFSGGWTYGLADATCGWTARVRHFGTGDDRVSSTGRTLRCVEAHHIRPAPNARGLIDRRWHRERSALSIIRLVAAARGACLRLGQYARGPTPYRGGAPAVRSAHVYRCFYGADKDPAAAPHRAAPRASPAFVETAAAAVGLASRGACPAEVFRIFRCRWSITVGALNHENY